MPGGIPWPPGTLMFEPIRVRTTSRLGIPPISMFHRKMTFSKDAVLTVVQPAEGENVAIPGFGAVFKLTGQTTGGLVAIVEHPFAVGLITAAHRHTHEDEHSLVIAGEIGFRSDDNEVVLGPGGYITKPRGQMHAMWNAGSEPGRIVEVITPGVLRTTSVNWANC